MESSSPIIGNLGLRWKALHEFDSIQVIPRENIVFNFAPNPGVFSQFRLQPDHSYVPRVLQPTVVYHQAIRRLLKRRTGVDLGQARFPYRINVPKLASDVSVTLQTRLYPPNILSITVVLSPVQFSMSTESLIRIQDLQDLKPISDIVRWTIGLVETLTPNPSDGDHSFRSKPLVQLLPTLRSDQFREEIEQHFPEYVGILIRNLHYDHMQPGIVERILEKNAVLNVKSTRELLLLDKQGLLFLSADTSPIHQRSAQKRLSKAFDLMELALVFSSYLDRFRSLRVQQEPLADFLLHKMSPLILNPDAVLAESVTNREMWHLLLKEFGLREKLAMATKDLSASFAQNRSYLELMVQGWWKRDDLGAILSDRLAQLKGLQLAFIADDDLRNLIAADYEEAGRSLAARNYKSTILLSGSIVEALLTSVLLDSRIPGLSREKLLGSYVLADLIDAAQKADILSDKILVLHLDSLRHYRNLIHPGVQIRKSVDPNESRARIAFETVNLLIRELNRWTAKMATADKK